MANTRTLDDLVDELDRGNPISRNDLPPLVRHTADQFSKIVRLAGAVAAAALEKQIEEIRPAEKRRLERPIPSGPPPQVLGDKIAITVKEAARLLRLSEAGIRLHIARRNIAVVRLGRSVRIPKTEIDRLISENLVPRLPKRWL